MNRLRMGPSEVRTEVRTGVRGILGSVGRFGRRAAALPEALDLPRG
jgi:hypothetical protein